MKKFKALFIALLALLLILPGCQKKPVEPDKPAEKQTLDYNHESRNIVRVRHYTYLEHGVLACRITSCKELYLERIDLCVHYRQRYPYFVLVGSRRIGRQAERTRAIMRIRRSDIRIIARRGFSSTAIRIRIERSTPAERDKVFTATCCIISRLEVLYERKRISRQTLRCEAQPVRDFIQRVALR